MDTVWLSADPAGTTAQPKKLSRNQRLSHSCKATTQHIIPVEPKVPVPPMTHLNLDGLADVVAEKDSLQVEGGGRTPHYRLGPKRLTLNLYHAVRVLRCGIQNMWPH
jgi:hypothetical protein